MSEDETGFTRSSGNVFADMGLPDPEERLLKARLARLVNKVVRQRGWTQQQAADVLGITQPKVSNLSRGRLGSISVEQLMRFLVRLDQRVTVNVSGDALPEEEIVVGGERPTGDTAPESARG